MSSFSNGKPAGPRRATERQLQKHQAQECATKFKPRRLTVLNFRQIDRSTVPKLHLAGLWLEQAGFLPGSRVLVTVRQGKLVVEMIAPPDPKWRRKPPPGLLYASEP